MTRFQTRHLQPEDVAALLDLEHSKWEAGQAACADTLVRRIETYPDLCIGAFCPTTCKALASLFMRPIHPQTFAAPTCWEKAADVGRANRLHEHSRSLFGISLSSNDAAAVHAIFRFFYPRALHAGWRDIYIGSPIPGFRRAREKNPGLSIGEYVHEKRGRRSAEPVDPQLRYYFRKGFRQIVSIEKNYFPHTASMDYGVILRGTIPFSGLCRLWRLAPLPVLDSLSRLILPAQAKSTSASR